MTQFYLNTASTGSGDGTTTATAGANAAWRDISEITGLGAGDIVLFNKGNEWRERLTVGASGSIGSPITFSSYGAGADPIINGADLPTDFSVVPTDISNCQLWLKADSLSLNDDDDVAAWADSSGNSNDAAQGTGAKQPVYKTGILNSLPIVRFDGAAHYMQVANHANLNAATVTFFVVAKSDIVGGSYGNDGFLVNKENSSGPGTYGISLETDVNDMRAQIRLNGSEGTARTADVDSNLDTNWHTYMVIYDGDNLNVYDNGSIQTDSDGTDGTIDVDTSTSFTIGAHPAPQRFWDGDIAEIIVYDKALSAIEITQVESYLDNKYALSGTVFSDIYTKAVTTEPKIAIFDRTPGSNAGSIAACDSVREWYWASNILYVYSVSDPDTLYASPGIEVGARNNVIYGDGKSYITVDGLDVRYANINNILFENASSDVIVQNCFSYYPFVCSIRMEEGVDDVTIDSNTILGNMQGVEVSGAGFIYIKFGSSTGTISNNSIDGGSNRAVSGQGIGIYLRGDTAKPISDYTISGNTITRVTNHAIDVSDNIITCIIENNDIDIVGDLGGQDGKGIQVATADKINEPVDSITVRYNNVRNTALGGISLGGAENSSIHYNIVTDCGQDDGGGGAYYAGISMVGNSDTITVYNNVIYNIHNEGSGEALGLFVDDSTNVTLKNNIVHTIGRWFIMWFGTYTGGVATNNYYFTSGKANKYFWNGTDYTTLAAYQAASSLDSNSVEADPLMTNPGADDFTLQATSPCINGGTSVGLTTDYAGNRVPSGGGVDIGAYERQVADEMFVMGAGFDFPLRFLE